MKIVSKRVGHFSNIERYDMNGVFSESSSNKGLVICFALAVTPNAKFTSLELKAKSEEIGIIEKWHKKYSQDSFGATFTSLESFLSRFNTDDFGRWTITTIYQNVEVVISGEKEGTEIGLSYPKEHPVNALPLLSSIETSTYAFCRNDREVIELLEESFSMTEKRAVLAIQKLKTHNDICNEFLKVIFSKHFVENTVALTVEGFTAEKLNANYPLSVLGAYNYLIYLRENPKEALEELKKGLPRK